MLFQPSNSCGSLAAGEQRNAHISTVISSIDDTLKS